MDLDWRDDVETDSRFFRPSEVHALVGDPSKAAEQFAWNRMTSFPELFASMVHADVERLESNPQRSLHAATAE